MIAVGGGGHEDDAGVSQNSDLAILLGSVTEKEYHNAKNILLCLESKYRMELRGTLLPLLLHQYAFPAHLRLGRRCGEKTGASATSLGSYLLPEGWKRHERM